VSHNPLEIIPDSFHSFQSFHVLILCSILKTVVLLNIFVETIVKNTAGKPPNHKIRSKAHRQTQRNPMLRIAVSLVKTLHGPIDSHRMEKKKSQYRVNSQQQKKEIHTGLEQLEGE